MTQNTKKGFVIYYDYRKHLSILTDEERGKLLTALLDYGESHKPPELDGAALMAFSFITSQLDRDAEKYAETVRKRSEAGKQGGRPRKATASKDEKEKAEKANGFSEKQTEAKKGDTVTGTGTVTVTDINIDTPLTPHGGTDAPDGGPAAVEPTPYKAIADMYQAICQSYPKLRNVGDSRKRAIAARWKEYRGDLDTFRELFSRAEASQFLQGKNPRNWAADFDWLMNSKNMAKVLEGKYDDNKQNGGQANNGEHSEHSGAQERRETGNETTLSGFRMAGC